MKNFWSVFSVGVVGAVFCVWLFNNSEPKTVPVTFSSSVKFEAQEQDCRLESSVVKQILDNSDQRESLSASAMEDCSLYQFTKCKFQTHTNPDIKWENGICELSFKVVGLTTLVDQKAKKDRAKCEKKHFDYLNSYPQTKKLLKDYLNLDRDHKTDLIFWIDCQKPFQQISFDHVETFIHEAHHALSSSLISNRDKDYIYYKIEGSVEVDILNGFLDNGNVYKDLANFDVLGSIPRTYFRDLPKNNLYLNLDEWNAYLETLELRLDFVKLDACGDLVVKYGTIEPRQWAIATEKYLFAHSNLPVFEKISKAPRLRAFINNLILKTDEQIPLIDSRPCLGLGGVELEGAYKFSRDRLKRILDL